MIATACEPLGELVAAASVAQAGKLKLATELRKILAAKKKLVLTELVLTELVLAELVLTELVLAQLDLAEDLGLFNLLPQLLFEETSSIVLGSLEYLID